MAKRIILSSLKADLDREAKGDWEKHPYLDGLELNVSSLLSPAYLAKVDALRVKLEAARPAGERVPDEIWYPELGKIFAHEILHDWRGIADDEGKDIPFSREKAEEILSNYEYRELIVAVQICAQKISQLKVRYTEEAAKN